MKSQNLQDFIEIIKILDEYFNGDESRIFAWLYTQNKLFAHLKPMYIIEIGKSDKLLSFVKENF